MCMRLTVLSSRLRRCKRGATAVEFAFVFPLFLLIVLGLFELGLMAYTSVALESMVTYAGRQATIGNLTGTGTHSEQVKAMIESDVKNLIGGENATISANVLSVTQVGGFSEPDYCNDPPGYPPTCPSGNFVDLNNDGEYTSQNNFGGSEEVVQIRVALPWRANFDFVKDIFGEDGMAVLEASTIVKNEPF